MQGITHVAARAADIPLDGTPKNANLLSKKCLNDSAT